MPEQDKPQNSLHPALTFILIIGLLISTIGDEIYLTVMMLQLQDLASSGYIIAAFLASQLIPGIFLAPFAGLLIDRFETSRVLIITQVLQTLLLIAMANTTELSFLLIGATLLGSLFAISQPALYTLIPSIAERSKLSTKRVNATVEFFSRSAMLFGPALGGLLLGTLGASSALLLDAASFAIAALIILFVGVRRYPDKTGKTKKLFEGAFEGITFIRKDPILGTAMPVILVGFIAISLVGVSAIFLVRDVMGASPLVYGIFSALWGLGMLFGSATAGRSKNEDYLEYPSMLSMAFMGTSLFFLGAFPRYIVLLITEIYGGISNGIMNVSINSMLHKRAPKEMHGRVFAAYMAIGRTAIIVGYAIASPFAANHSTTLYMIAGVLTTLVGIIGFTRVRALNQTTTQ